MKEDDDDGIIARDGDLLMVNKPGLIEIIKNNTDKNSTKIDSALITMINCSYEHLSVKQINWIFSKVKFIIRTNRLYFKFNGIKDIQFV
jgi:hypothetical protein